MAIELAERDPGAAETVGEKAYRQVRADIVAGMLPPGRKLKLDQMRQRYGASVSTMRELLSRLASEGLVVAESQRGFEVAPVSAKDLREIAALRLLLEGHALALSFARGDVDWEGRVVAAHHKLGHAEARLGRGDLAEIQDWKRYDFEFHRALIGACGSDALLAAHQPVYDKYLRYQMIAGIYRGEVAGREHDRLLKCALQRDAEGAQALLKRHIEDCVEFTLAEGAYAFR